MFTTVNELSLQYLTWEILQWEFNFRPVQILSIISTKNALKRVLVYIVCKLSIMIPSFPYIYLHGEREGGI